MNAATLPQVGDSPAPRTVGPITRTDIVRYAGASGDFNAIHHDEHFATAAGFPTVFSIGMYQASILTGFATDWLGAANLRNVKVRFLEQVWPDDTLTCSAVVRDVVTDGATATVELDLLCVRDNGGPAISGSATFDLGSS